MVEPPTKRPRMASPDTTQENRKYDAPVELPSCPHASSPPSSDAYGSVITISVGKGEAKRTFQIHEGLLKHHSEYFTTALKEIWREDNSKPIELPEDDAFVFQHVFRWIYTGKLYHELLSNGRIPLDIRIICKTYMFGDMCGMPRLCNASIDVLFQSFCQKWAYPIYEAHFIYNNTCEGSALRKLFALIAAEVYSWGEFETSIEDFPNALLVDVISLLKNSRMPLGSGAKTPWIQKTRLAFCGAFHHHGARKVLPTPRGILPAK